MSKQKDNARRVAPRDEVADILEEVEPYRTMSMEERDLRLQQVLRIVDWWLSDVKEARQRLAWQDPVPNESRALWRRLIEAARRT